MESKNNADVQEMNTEVIIKQEACFLERTLTEVKSESEVNCGSDVHVKSESASFASVFVVQPDSNVHGYYREVEAKIQIKGEPGNLETISSELNCDLHVKDEDMQDNTLREDHDIISSEPSRVGTQATWNYESGVSSADLDKDCLKRREINNPRHENSNTNTGQEDDITKTAQVDDKILHKCKYCGRCFIQASQLQSHVERHESNKKHKCNVCSKMFLTASRLKRHGFIHAGIRPFKCDKCEKSFTASSNLNRHKLYHEGKRPHKCDHCEKTFTEASHLKTHNLIHEGIRPFKCDKCDKRFTTSSNLKTHNLFHKGIKSYKCEICEKSYIIASHLKNHALIHASKTVLKSEISKESFILGF